MNIVYKLVDFIASYIELFVLYEIYAELFAKNIRKKNILSIKILATVVGAIMVAICNHVSIFSYFTMIMGAVYMSISALLLFKINWIPLFSVASFYILCLSYFDFFIISLFSYIWRDENIMATLSVQGLPRLFFILTVKTLWIIFFWLCKDYIKVFQKKVKRMYFVLILSIVGFCGFTFLVEQTCNMLNYSLTGVWLAMVLGLAFFIFITYFLIVRQEEKNKLHIETMRSELLEEKYESIQKIYSSNAKLYHDMNNHLNVLYQLLDDENTEKAKEYIKEIGQPIKRLSKTVWTGEEVVDAVIKSKVEIMKEKDIEYEINAEFPDNSNIAQHDMCTILANLLDNAIEATSKLEDNRRISLTIRNINQFLVLKVSNTCIYINQQFDSLPKTTKDNKQLHGWGLPSVLAAVKKYNGTMECFSVENEFTVSIMMFWETVKTK
ncbi:MAG: GHKL domain-containing protein [Tyzzerella sp.]|nr:GHKL domain-containing protein [Tyzzerella sp.]